MWPVCFVLIRGLKWSNWCICPLVCMCSRGNVQQQSTDVKKCYPWANCALIGQKSNWKDLPEGDNVLSSLFPQKKKHGASAACGLICFIVFLWLIYQRSLNEQNIQVYRGSTLRLENKVMLHLIRCRKELPVKMGSASFGLADCSLIPKELLQGSTGSELKPHFLGDLGPLLVSCIQVQ